MRLTKKAAAACLRYAVPLALVVPCLVLCGCEERPTTGGDSPVTAERLTGTRLKHIKQDLSWTFSPDTVVIENDQQPIPVDLATALLGDEETVNRIEAGWQFDEESGLLRLSEFKVDGEPFDHEASIPIRPAGHVRVNLGTRQYNMFRDAVKEP